MGEASERLSSAAMTQSGAALIELRDLTVAFHGQKVVRGLNLAIARGEALGMVGESGSGKSVTWLAALGLLPRHAAVTGEARLDGRNIIGTSEAELSRIRGGRIGLVFQDPISALNPVRRVGAQLIEALRLHRGLTGAAAKAEARRLFELVGIPDAKRRLDLYPHELSGGQNQRVMIAMALAGEPELLIADEPTTALDTTIQAQILGLIDRLRREIDMALILISHDLGVVAELCERIVVLYAGGIVEEAPAERILSSSAHPYTQGLIAAQPPLSGARRRLTPIAGQVPEPWNMPSGCVFAPRCQSAIPDCSTAVPPMLAAGPQQRAACIRLGETGDASSVGMRMSG
jgi:peptide/nickel transport system ATP-binding protein